MKILFISHTYPPVRGGVENQNFFLAQSLKEITEVKIIANGRGKKFLPIFLPLTFLRALFLMSRYDACLLGNGVLAPIGYWARLFHSSKKYFCVVHGLDITFANKNGLLSKIYKKINIPALKKLDHLFMVGNATIDEAEKVGIPRCQCTFIPNGVNYEDIIEKHERSEMEPILGVDVSDKKVIMRLSRFVPHKGTSWFIENVMPLLPSNYFFVAAGARVGKNTAGDKDDFVNCEKIIEKKSLHGQVKLIPFIPEDQKIILLNSVDLVVSPNIKIEGTMEGFGINVIEAGACGRIVVASNMEGLADAIKDGENGFLVESGNAEAYAEKIKQLLSDQEIQTNFGSNAAKYVEENYNWKKIAARYYEEMNRYHGKKELAAAAEA